MQASQTVIPPPDQDRAVDASLRYCHAVTRDRARNFYYGLKLTPEPRRSAGYVIYAFMRACDDLVDAEDGGDEPTPAVGAQRVERFREMMTQALDAGPGDPLPPGELWPGFRHVCQTYPIDRAHLHAMLDGQRADLVTHRYASFEQLYRYCYNVASVVGLTCIAIWGSDGKPGTLQLAEHRGIALQLTNILRDVVEDARRGRCYLPTDELERFGCSVDDLSRGRGGAGFDRLMAFQIERARGYYLMSAALEQRIAPDCRATSWAIMRIYRELLERIAQNPRRVLTQRIRLSPPAKLRIALHAAWKRRWPV